MSAIAGALQPGNECDGLSSSLPEDARMEFCESKLTPTQLMCYPSLVPRGVIPFARKER